VASAIGEAGNKQRKRTDMDGKCTRAFICAARVFGRLPPEASAHGSL